MAQGETFIDDMFDCVDRKCDLDLLPTAKGETITIQVDDWINNIMKRVEKR